MLISILLYKRETIHDSIAKQRELVLLFPPWNPPSYSGRNIQRMTITTIHTHNTVNSTLYDLNCKVAVSLEYYTGSHTSSIQFLMDNPGSLTRIVEYHFA